MTIDPMNAPIFGDVVPADPPGPVRLASALLFGNVLLSAGYRLFTDLDASFPIFLIPLLLSVWITLSVRAGRGWARPASAVLTCVLIAMMALLIDYAMVGLLVLAVSAGAQIIAMRLIWRPEVSEYFQR